VVLAVAFVQLGLWVAVRRDGWLVDRFLLAPVSLLLVGFSPAIDWLCLRRGLTKSIFCGGMLVLIWYQGVYVNRHRREALSIVLGRVNREQWLAQSVPGSPYADLTRLLGKLAPDQRLFLPGRLYYIPDDELAYISKEQDTVEFESVPDIEKCSYLREHHYKYYVELRAGQPPWTSALVRVAAGDEYSIFRI
jgi:hypothetical protein